MGICWIRRRKTFRWEGKLYAAGVRRDLDTVGTGRMELSELVVGDDEVFEFSRYRPNSQTKNHIVKRLDARLG